MTSALLMIKEVVSYMNGCVLKKGLFHHSAEVATEDVNIINVGSRSRCSFLVYVVRVNYELSSPVLCCAASCSKDQGN